MTHRRYMGTRQMRQPRPSPWIDGDVVIIPLPGGLQAIADAADFELIKRYTWAVIRPRGRCYAYAADPYGRPGGRSHVYLHRLLTQATRFAVVDHVNGNRLDNRRANLRVTSQSMNMANRRVLSEHKSSRFKGVTWDAQRNRWMAKIKREGKGRYLGRFVSEEEAARAYDRAAIDLFGPYAATNAALGLLGDSKPPALNHQLAMF